MNNLGYSQKNDLRGRVLLITLLFSAATFANPQVRIYQEPSLLDQGSSPSLPATSPQVQSPLSDVKEHPSAFSASIPEPLNTPLEDKKKLPLDQQIKLIDSEILLLKAELARKNGDLAQVKQFLEALNLRQASLFSPDMQARIISLNQYVTQTMLDQKLPDSNQKFVFNSEKIVALLPLTGDYGEMGEAVLKGLQSVFPDKKIMAFDTHVYNTMTPLWQLVKLYNPTLVFGPLQASNAQMINDLDTQVPTFFLNEVSQLKPYDRSLSLNRNGHVKSVITQAVTNRLEGITLLVDETSQSQSLLKSFQYYWSSYATQNPELTQHFRIRVQTIHDRVDAAIEQLVGGTDSQVRKNWLRNTIKHPLEFEERSRQDMDLIISLVSNRIALQVAPLLKYYRLGSVQHYWLPSELPSYASFEKSLPYWSSSYAFLPKYFADVVTNNLKDSSLVPDNDQIGIFHAFGELAAKIVKESSSENTREWSSSLGKVMMIEGDNPQILPELYWLNQGEFTDSSP